MDYLIIATGTIGFSGIAGMCFLLGVIVGERRTYKTPEKTDQKEKKLNEFDEKRRP